MVKDTLYTAMPPTNDVLGARKESARSKSGMSIATSMQVSVSDPVDPSWFQPPPALRDKGAESDRSHSDLRDRVAARTPPGSGRGEQ